VEAAELADANSLAEALVDEDAVEAAEECTDWPVIVLVQPAATNTKAQPASTRIVGNFDIRPPCLPKWNVNLACCEPLRQSDVAGR
jgi:hypothetical protein